MTKDSISGTDSAHNNTKRLILSWALFIYPTTVLLVPNLNGLILLLISILGIGIIISRHNPASQPERDETLMFFSTMFFCVVAYAVTFDPSLEFGFAKKFLHLLLIIPLYVYLKRTGISLAFLWIGLASGAIITSAISFYDVYILNLERAKGLTHPIIFGDLSLLMGFLSLAGYSWFKKQSSWLILLPVLAITASLMSSVLSQTRGSWIALPFLVMILLWSHRTALSFRLKASLITGCIALIIAAYAIPQTKISSIIDRSITNFQTYYASEITSPLRATSLGARLEMWQASYSIFKQHPVTGVGWGRYQEQVHQMIERGERNKAIGQFAHPHNQFFSAAAKGGLVSLFALLLLFLVPLRIFYRYSKQKEHPEITQLANAGMVLVVAFMIFGLTESIFERSRPINFFVFYLAIFMAALQHQLQRTAQKQHKRKHTLSVTIITKNEADRVEPCLQSVHGWADEIIVLDSGSTDNTLEIARRYTEHVFETDWPGYGIQKQRALEKANCDWVLSIDADERVSDQLRHDIDRVLSTDTPEHTGYKTPWAVMLYGHRMDFGRSARAPLRLFKREGARFSDSMIHERIILPDAATVGKLNGRLLHYTHRNFGHGITKAGDYAWLSSQKYFSENRWGGGLAGATLRSIWTFFLIYIIRLGFLDGSAGYLSAVGYAQNSFNKYAGLWSLRREKKKNTHPADTK